MDKDILNTELGHYKPSFFEISLNSSDMLNYDVFINSPTFVHEYVHFLQDISTTFGMINTCRTVDYIKSLMNNIANNSEDKIELPIDMSNLHESVLFNDRLFAEAYFGDPRPFLYDPPPVIMSVNAEPRKVAGMSPDIISIGISYGGVIEEHLFQFGATAIMESMAHIVEQYLFPDSPPASLLHYHLAEMVVEHEYPQFATPLNVLMLCDASLLSYNPGEAFFYILQELKKQSYMPSPSSLSDFYQFADSCIHFPKGSAEDNLFSLFSQSAFLAEKQIGELVTAKELSAIGKWASTLIKNGARKRIAKTHFIPELLTIPKEEAKLKFRDTFFRELQLPVVTNALGMAVATWEGDENGVASPILLPTMYDVYASFRYGRKNSFCTRKIGCLNSPAIVNVNDLCDNSPWKRVDDPNGLCLFALACHLWRIPTHKEFILNG